MIFCEANPWSLQVIVFSLLFPWLCTGLLQGLNAALFWEKVDFKEYIPMVPTSAITGDGMGDLIALLVSFSLKMLTKQLMLSMELEALVLEVSHMIPLIIIIVIQ
jgi:translation initiation factor IF-2